MRLRRQRSRTAAEQDSPDDLPAVGDALRMVGERHAAVIADDIIILRAKLLGRHVPIAAGFDIRFVDGFVIDKEPAMEKGNFFPGRPMIRLRSM